LGGSVEQLAHLAHDPNPNHSLAIHNNPKVATWWGETRKLPGGGAKQGSTHQTMSHYHHHHHLLSKDQKDEYSKHKKSELEAAEVAADRLVGWSGRAAGILDP
jgi:hypothetical protein